MDYIKYKYNKSIEVLDNDNFINQLFLRNYENLPKVDDYTNVSHSDFINSHCNGKNINIVPGIVKIRILLT